MVTLRGFASFPLTDLRPDDVIAGIIPMAHIFGSVMLNATLRAGARIVDARRASTSRRSSPWSRSTG